MNKIIVHSFIAESVLTFFPKESITIIQDGIFDFILPKRSIAYKILQFPPDFSQYKRIKSYKHVEIILLNCPEDLRDSMQMKALPLPVTFARNLHEIWILLANACSPPIIPSSPDVEVMAKFIQIANSCSEYDALLLAQERQNLADYFSQ